MSKIENWGYISKKRGFDVFRRSIDDIIKKDDDLKIYGWICVVDGSKKRNIRKEEYLDELVKSCRKSGDSIRFEGPICFQLLFSKNLGIYAGKLGTIIVYETKKVQYQPGFFWADKSKSDSIRKYLKKRGLLKKKHK